MVEVTGADEEPKNKEYTAFYLTRDKKTKIWYDPFSFLGAQNARDILKQENEKIESKNKIVEEPIKRRPTTKRRIRP